MDITVEDGTGIVIANTYLSVAEADDILSINIHSTWSLLDDETKERLLMWATRVLDERATWKGRKLHATSGTAWPRTGVRDKEGFLIEDNVVPPAVKYATAVLAEHLVKGNPDVVNSSSNLTELQVDVITIKFDTDQSPSKWPANIKLILASLATVAMGKGGPKRIVMH